MKLKKPANLSIYNVPRVNYPLASMVIMIIFQGLNARVSMTTSGPHANHSLNLVIFSIFQYSFILKCRFWE